MVLYCSTSLCFHCLLQWAGTSLLCQGLEGSSLACSMNKEYQALLANHTCDLIPPPWDQDGTGCKWVYKMKQKLNGSIDQFKARLVECGYSQPKGINYDATISLIIKLVTILVVLSMTTSLRWPIRQLDIKNALLHGFLSKEVYIQQPPGFVD